MTNKQLEEFKKIKGATGRVRNKSKSKRMGVKSTFVTAKGVAVNSFFHTQNAQGEMIPNVEIMTSRDGRETYRSNLRMFYRADVDEATIRLESRFEQGMSDVVEFPNPAAILGRGDYVGIKSALEKKYFGAEFPEDNIHVQIGYNIADLKKHLALYVNQIIYSIYNINRHIKSEEKDDVVGMLYTFADLDHQRFEPTPKGQEKKANQDKLLQGVYFYNTYYPGVFRIPKRLADGSISEAEQARADHHNFNVFRLLSLIRQGCEHEALGSISADRYLYDLEHALSARGAELTALLDKLYGSVPGLVDREFLAHARHNLYMLSKIFPDESIEVLTERYYRFAMLKEQNNIGISTKLLREILIESYMGELRDKRYIPCRGKIYSVIGFTLCEILRDGTLLKRVKERLHRNDSEEGRLQIYCDLASLIWEKHGVLLGHAKSVFDEELENKFKTPSDFTVNMENASYAMSRQTSCYFSKLMLLMTRFLDNKEVNTLLSGLISRFENIADLTKSALECGVTISYTPTYWIFENASRIADELRLIKSMARIKPKVKSYPNAMLLDAATLLGVNGLVDEGALTTEERAAAGSAFLARVHGDGETGGRVNHQLRNFIINNVIKSRWFFYITRYARPADCKKLMANEALLRFALKELPDDQVCRYYKSVSGGVAESPTKAREALYTWLYKFEIDTVLDSVDKMRKRDFSSQDENSPKQQSRAIVGLYLTLVYLIIKSVVKVNAVYFVAFSCLERDLCLKGFTAEQYLALTGAALEGDALHLAAYTERRNAIRDNKALDADAKRAAYKELKPIVSQMHYTLHGYYCNKQNYDHALLMNTARFSLFKGFRNNVAHLSVPANLLEYVGEIKSITSYYGVFVYCMERTLLDSAQKYAGAMYEEVFARYAEKLRRTGVPDKNFMWVANVPFAYNMARYKSLSIEDLFYGRPSKEKVAVGVPQAEPVLQASAQGLPYAIGAVVKIDHVEAKPNGGLRGTIRGTDVKVTLPKSCFLKRPIGLFIGKILTVELTRWDANANAYNAKFL